MKNNIQKVGEIVNTKIVLPIKRLFTTDVKMKLLVAYLIGNLLYVLISSYIFMTGKITENFHYKQYSLGLRNILILNIFVFLVICFEKRYKKNWAHLFMIFIVIFRCHFCVFCF